MKKEISNYNHHICEQKWRKNWEDSKIFKFDENSLKEKYYVLEMFPYPSGKIHMGHLRNYTIGDVISRFKMMQGFNVLHPMGFDAFGLPAENAALQHNIHPKDWTLKNIETMKEELKSIGLSLDWSKQVVTCLPEYFKHEQKIFLDFFKNNLAYQKESFVNWDPIDKTVLANEQVVDGRGWRSGAVVEKKKLRQWFLKVSEFSQNLLDELKNLKGWDDRVLSMQEKWIGKSEGLKLCFSIKKNDILSSKKTKQGPQLEIYTTRPETIFGASFIAISPNHPLAMDLAIDNKEIARFIEECNKISVNEEAIETQEKKGIRTNLKAQHPFEKNLELDIYIANFVLMDYGTGALFGCPAHDQRDFEFAKKYNLSIKNVIVDKKNLLESTDLIDFNSPSIINKINELKKDCIDEKTYINRAFRFVCEEINHAMDDETYLKRKPLIKASEVLEEKIAFGFGKCSLFAALLRGNKISCGFSDQLLMLDEQVSKRKIIHTVVSLFSSTENKWIRLDPRGNVIYEVNDAYEKLAYKARDEYQEVNDLGFYYNFPREVYDLYNKSKTNSEIIDNLFEKSSAYDIDQIYSEDGIMINSQFLNGLESSIAKKEIIKEAQSKKVGNPQTNFRLRDWGVSRQRYWGCPIPIIYLVKEDGTIDKDNPIAVSEDQLPVELPQDVEFKGHGGNPLEQHPTWKYTTYSDDNGKIHKAIRETDTFDTFFESSWYFLRYVSQPQNKAFDRDIVNKFMPVDQYIGGIEHAVLHLLYARFFVKALKKCGYLDFDEPFKSLLTQGMVCHHTFKNLKGEWVFPKEAIEIEKGKFVHEKTREPLIQGRLEKMSKSKKNVVEPLAIVENYGADTARLFMLSDSPASRDLEWSESGIDGSWKYINRIWRLVCANADPSLTECSDLLQNISDISTFSEKSLNLIKLTNKTIEMVTLEYENMGFNRAIAKIREFSNAIEKFQAETLEEKKAINFALKNLTLLITPIMPHLAEECFSALGHKGLASQANFPTFDKNLTLESTTKLTIQVSSKVRAVIEAPKGSGQEEIERLARQNPNVIKFLENSNPQKIIFVRDKLINFVL